MSLPPIAALAAPPPPGSADYEALAPFADWIASQKTDLGGFCCSMADCRVVDWRSAKDGGIEVFLALSDSKGFTKFEGAPNAWVEVPPMVIHRGENPTGYPIACWSKAFQTAQRPYATPETPFRDGFYCVFMPDLT